MVVVLTEEQYEKYLKSFQQNLGTEYFKLSTDDGLVNIKFLTPIYYVEKGDKDLAGNIWKYDDKKHEAKAIITKGDTSREVIYGFGGEKSPNLREFLRALKRYNLKVSDIVNSKWSVIKTGTFKYEYIYKGKD